MWLAFGIWRENDYLSLDDVKYQWIGWGIAGKEQL